MGEMVKQTKHDEQLGCLLAIDGNREALRQLQQKYNAGLVSPFIGAGMSVPFGFPLWDQMLRQIAEDVGLIKNASFIKHFPENLPRAASFLIKEASANHYQKSLRRIFASDTIAKDHGSTSKSICRILEMWNQRGPVFTTNFDPVIELHMERMGITFANNTATSINGISVKSVVKAIDHREFQLVKLHGDVDVQTGRIDSETAYNMAYNKDDGYLLAVFRKLIFARTLLFLGCGLKDKTADVLKAEFNANAEVAFEHFAIAECNRSGTPAKRFGKYLANRGVTPLWIPPNRFDLIESLLEGLRTNIFRSRSHSAAIDIFVAARRSSVGQEQGPLASCPTFVRALGFEKQIPASKIIRRARQSAYVVCDSSSGRIREKLATLQQYVEKKNVQVVVVIGNELRPTGTMTGECTQLARDVLFLAKSQSQPIGRIPVLVRPEISDRLGLNADFNCVSIERLVKVDARLSEHPGWNVFLLDKSLDDNGTIQVDTDARVSLVELLRETYPDVTRLQEKKVTWRETPKDKFGKFRPLTFEVQFDGQDWHLSTWPPLSIPNRRVNHSGVISPSESPYEFSWNEQRIKIQCCSIGDQLDVKILTQTKNKFMQCIYGAKSCERSVRVVHCDKSQC